MNETNTAYLLTDDEQRYARQLLQDDWIAATVWVNGRLGAPPGLGLQTLGRIAGWSREDQRRRLRDKDRQAAQTAANLPALKRTMAGVVVIFIIGCALAWAQDWGMFLEFGFPLALGLWVIWSGVRARVGSGGGWIGLGIALVVISGLVIAASEDGQGRMSTSGVPLLFLALVALSLGIAQAIFGTNAQYGADSPDRVISARRAFRVTSVNIAVQAFVVQLPFYWLIQRAGAVEEELFNAAFRYLLFVPALGVALGLSMSLSSNHLTRAILGALTPPVICLLYSIGSEQGIYALILQWAIIDILVFLLILPLGGLMLGEGKTRLIGFGAGLIGALVLGTLAFGMVRLGVLELLHIGAFADRAHILFWIVVPALVVAAVAIRPDSRSHRLH